VLTFIVIDAVSPMPFIDSMTDCHMRTLRVQSTLQGPIIYNIPFISDIGL